MNKKELINRIAEEASISISQAEKVVESFLRNVTFQLEHDKIIMLRGFGTFSVKKREARIGINPATRKQIKISAKKVAKFKAGKELSAKM